jgi:hypothetical protein
MKVARKNVQLLKSCYDKFGSLNYAKLVEEGHLKIQYDGYGDKKTFAPITLEKNQD